MRLRGGILYYTLFLMLISVTMISLVLIRHTIFQRSYIYRTKSEELDLNIRSAFLLYKQEPEILYNKDSITIDLYHDSLAIVHLRKENWGIFDIITVSTEWKDLFLSRAGIFGEVVDKNSPSLYLADHGTNITLSGNSMITGKSYTPRGMIKIASVEGQPFIHESLSKESVMPSKNILPGLNPVLDSTIKGLFNMINPEVRLSEINRKTNWSFENVFKNPTVTYFDDQDVLLSGLSFKGRIIICAPGTIIVDQSASLKDVLLVARRVVIGDGFKGSFQAFAIDSIGIGNDVNLIYPSVLCIASNDDDGTSTNQVISIGEKTKVTGCIILKSITPDKCKLIIPETSLITGQAYCNGDIKLRGDVHGSVFCNSFSFTSERSTYVNHLLDSDIDIESIPEGFCGFSIGDSSSVRGLIKWFD